MKRTSLFLVLFFCLGFFPAACGTQEKRPSQDVLLARDAFGLLERLNNAYSAKDMAALEALCTVQEYASLKQEIGEFRSVALEFRKQWVNIREDGTMEVQVAWSGKWTLKGDGPAVSGSGKAVFVLSSGQPTKLVKITGSSPFAGPPASDTP